MNRMMTVEEVEAFVHSDYAGRDIMHNLAHINRLQKLAKEIAKSYEHDSHLLELGAYFHGNISFKEAEIRQFLKDKQLQQHEIDYGIIGI